MTFPTTSTIDTFSGSGYSTKWPGFSSLPRLYVTAGQAASDGISADFGGYFQPGLFGADQEAYLTFVNNVTDGSIYLILRSSDPSNYFWGYTFNFIFSAGLCHVSVSSSTISGFSVIGSTSDFTTPGAGESIGVSAIGSTLKVWVNTAATGGWLEIDSFSNSDITAGGYAAFYYNGATPSDNFKIDNFGGGSVLAAGAARAYTGSVGAALSLNSVSGVTGSANAALSAVSLTLALSPAAVRSDAAFSVGVVALALTSQSAGVVTAAVVPVNALALALSLAVAAVQAGATAAVNAPAVGFTVFGAGVRVDFAALPAALELEFWPDPVIVDADRAFMIGSRGYVSVAKSKALITTVGG